VIQLVNIPVPKITKNPLSGDPAQPGDTSQKLAGYTNWIEQGLTSPPTQHD